MILKERGEGKERGGEGRVREWRDEFERRQMSQEKVEKYEMKNEKHAGEVNAGKEIWRY